MKERKKSRITIQSAKAKGRNLQKWVCARVSALIQLPFGQEDDKLIQSRPMGQKGVDVILRGEAASRFRFSIECKSTETWDVPGAIRQAIKNKKPDTGWLVFMKRRAQNPVIILDADEFFNILTNLRNQVASTNTKEIIDFMAFAMSDDKGTIQ